MSLESTANILSVDAGASNVRSVVFNSNGDTIGEYGVNEGGNIAVDPEASTKVIMSTISSLLDKCKLGYDDISHFSLGIAGISNDAAREMLFKRLDERNISSKTHLSSDVNPIFEMNCADNSAILVSVGTGCICLGRNLEDKIEKVGGLGLDNDSGSGYWMGKELILNLTFNKSEDYDEKCYNELLQMSLEFYDATELNQAIDEIMSSSDRYRRIASICKPLFELAKSGNELALSIVQQGSQHIADKIILLCDKISYTNDDMMIISNGSIMKDSFFRKALSDALSFDFKNVGWLFPTIGSAYYPGLISCKILGLNININDILNKKTED